MSGENEQDDEQEASARREWEVVRDAVRHLAPKFDTVLILASRHISEEEGTLDLNCAHGNRLALIQQAREYVIRNDETQRERSRKRE